jgi:iron complex outermembrane recepter protein
MAASCTNYLLMGASVLAVVSATAAHGQTGAAHADVDEVIVTGSRLAATGFASPTPVTTVGARQLESLAATSFYNVTKDIPTFRNSAGPDNSNSGVVAASQAILDLRGLGGTRTLTLVDGVRPTPVNATATFDSGLVPIGLVDRVEVVTGGASAAYGSDALAGVVNIILKHRLEGLSGTVQYGVTQSGDGGEPSIGLQWGTSFAGGKGHFIVGGDTTRNYGVGTIYSRDWGRDEPGLLVLPSSRPAGLPANIIASHVELISNTPGGIVTSGPLRGTAFAPGGIPYAFNYGSLAGASTYIGTGNYGDTAFYTTNLRQEFKRNTLLARAEYEFTPDISGFAQVNYGALWSGGPASRQPNPGSYIVLRDNPYLPAETLQAMIRANLQSITVSRINTEYGPSSAANRLETYRAVAGLNGKFARSWDWDATVTAGRAINSSGFINIPNTADLYASAYVVRGANGQPVCGPTATNPYFNAQNPIVKAKLLASLDAGCAPSNVFGQGSISPDAVKYFLREANQHLDIRRYSAAANLRGSPFELPAGPVSLAVGFEWRRDTVNSVACNLCLANALTSTNSGSYHGAEDVKEVYGEVGAPVLKDLPMVKSLDLNGAVRRTDYSLSGAVTTWKLGATWDLTDFLRLRGTRSHDIRAPNINELFNTGSSGVINITNPLTGATGFVGSKSVGNPNLAPEVADTTVLGAVISPGGFFEGLRASVDYYKIDVSGVIGTLAAQTILNGYFLQGISEYGAFITQDSSAIGIQYVASTQLNLNRMVTDGADFEIVYQVPMDAMTLPGRFQVRALGTYTHQLRTVSGPTDLDAAGFASGLPKWVWNVNFSYNLEKLGVGLLVKYASSTGYSNLLVGPDDPNYSPTLSNSVNRNRWPASIYYTLNAQYQLLDEPNRRLQLFGVINNLFDKQPPIVAGVLFAGGSPYDTIGRAFRFGVRFEY